jgi:hypothetical protein
MFFMILRCFSGVVTSWGCHQYQRGRLLACFLDRRQRMMVGMFDRQSILVIDAKIRVFLSFMASMEKWEQKISSRRPVAQQ